jgi:sugar phosphate isomerase/epimerase
MLRAIEAIGMDNVGINFDTANLVLYGKANTADALDVFGKYVRNTHCKDGEYPTEGTKLGREVPLGEGRANMPAVMNKLSALGYEGPYIIEREIDGEEQIRDIVNARDLLRKIAAEV